MSELDNQIFFFFPPWLENNRNVLVGDLSVSHFHSDCPVNNSYGSGQIHNKAVITFIKLSENVSEGKYRTWTLAEPALTFWFISNLHGVCFTLIQQVQISRAHT